MPSVATQQSDYGLAIRGAVRALWKGLIDADQFYDWMNSAIWRGLTGAWYAGAAECNIQPSELSPPERSALQLVIATEINHVGDFAASIINRSQERRGKLSAHLNRAQMWTLRWQDVQTRARVMACGDKKLKWVLGETEHCSTCLKLADKVKRASQWAAAGIYPQMKALACGGYKCGCGFKPTSDPMSKGPLPSIP